MISVLEILSRLGISYKPSDIDGDELSILCPFHNDRHVGSFSINIITGFWNCYSCKVGSKSILGFIAKYLNIPYKEAKKWLDLDMQHPKNYAIEIKKKKWLAVETEIVHKTNSLFYPKNLSELNANDYVFFKHRNINQIFIDHFGWLLCTEGFYKGYIIIPVRDKGDIFSFEARKLMQYEALCKYFRQKEIGNERHLKALQHRFDVLDIDCKHSENATIRYLGAPKVLYTKNSRLKETIYNYDNLNKSETLHLVESVSSLPNIWNNVSTNCSATFGGKISAAQIELLDTFKEIIIYADNDDAGALTSEFLLKNLKKANLLVNEMLKDAARASKEELNRDPVPAGKWLFRKLEEMHNVII